MTPPPPCPTDGFLHLFPYMFLWSNMDFFCYSAFIFLELSHFGLIKFSIDPFLYVPGQVERHRIYPNRRFGGQRFQPLLGPPCRLNSNLLLMLFTEQPEFAADAVISGSQDLPGGPHKVLNFFEPQLVL